MNKKSALIIAIIALTLLERTNSDRNIHFPDEYEQISFKQQAPLASYSAVSPSRTTYEQYVDGVIANGIAKLSLAINKAYQNSSHSENVVFAPLNIAGALALILLGSNGRTFQELASVLGFATGLEIESKSELVHEQLGRIIKKIEETAGYTIGQQVTFAGAIFVQNDFPIRTLYQETARNLYESEVLNLNFQSDSLKAQQLINAWVSDRTNGKIKDILTEAPSPATKVIIASAMYFKAKWEHPFLDEQTARRPFYPNGRKSPTNIEVDMMANLGEFPFFKDKNLNCEILGLPYQGNASFMYIILPNESNIQKLREFEAKLTVDDLEQLAAKTTPQKVSILFPKMKIESTIDLKWILRILGVHSLFNATEANLGLISPGETYTANRFNNLNSQINPIGPTNANSKDILIFSRFGDTVNCSSIFDPNSNITTCQDTVSGPNGEQKVIYKKFGDKVGRRVVRNIPTAKVSNRRDARTVMYPRETIDSLRNLINQQSTDNNYQNPGLYADKVVHKVYMDITESGTEAAASTLSAIYRTSTRSFRVDVPFIFFIRHEETKTIMFWGSVDNPTPNYKKMS